MDPDTDIEMEEIREMAENMGRERREKVIEFSPRLVIGAIVVICVLFVVALFFTGGGKADIERINAIIKRLDRIEAGLSRYAETEKKMGHLDSQIKTLLKSDSGNKSLSRKVVEANRQIGLLKEEVSSLSKKVSDLDLDREIIISPAKGDYHVVQKGETLFGISRKYGLTMDKLRQMNKLPKDKSIIPGQKLVVK